MPENFRTDRKNDLEKATLITGAAPVTPATEIGISSPWTRSPGRVHFRDLVQRSIERRKGVPGYSFAIIYADLDRFGRINDSFGRKAGDGLLLEVVHRLRGCLRSRDVLTRLREDEYIIFLDDIQESGRALEIVDRIRESMRTPFMISGQQVFTSVSIGIAIGPQHYARAEEVVRDAESAMRQAKKDGLGSYRIFDPEAQEQARQLLKLETELRLAVGLGQLRLQYEPIIHLETGRVAGFEALVRWQHPERGLIYPADFLPLAEETRLIIPITRWVVRQACQQLREWKDRFPDFASLWVSVNLSPNYIEQCDFGQEVSSYVSETGVPAENLVIEITENQLLENADSILRGFSTLQNLGIKLWIDDFGAGYSSLAYLVKFPIHALKIDRSFIVGLLQDKSNVISTAIISLGRTLGVSVIAEGVNTSEQVEFLKKAQCPYGQGYFFSGSLDPETINSLFGKHGGA